MVDTNEAIESPATTLCKSCGLCCTGHLFVWTKLRSSELNAVEGLGLRVFREPNQRGFNQPCPLWDGQCTIYESPKYPRFCHTYKCKLLKGLLDENVQLPEALTTVQQALNMIQEIESLLPDLGSDNFRERLVAYLERGNPKPEFQLKAQKLLTFYDTHFGVKNIPD